MRRRRVPSSRFPVPRSRRRPLVASSTGNREPNTGNRGVGVGETVVTAYVGLGSNLGDRVSNCASAAVALGMLPETILGIVSPFYETEPEDGAGPQWFINGVVAIETALPPRQLLAELQAIEGFFDRPAERARGKNRTLDLDLLLYGHRVIIQPDLVVPHVRLHLRRFTLVPLCSVAPDLVHPGFGRPMSELLDALPPGPVVRPAEDGWPGWEDEETWAKAGGRMGRA